MQYSGELVLKLHIFYNLFGFVLLRSLVFETSRAEKKMKYKYLKKGVCGGKGGGGHGRELLLWGWC